MRHGPSTIYAERVHLKRVIPCLDVDGGRVVKGVEFVDIRDAGDPVELAVHYDREGADELVFLDITATHERRETIAALARRTADEVFVPFTIGGGIRSVADAQSVLDAGADKVSVNSAALDRPELIDELANVFGSQCVVLAVDAKALDPGALDPGALDREPSTRKPSTRKPSTRKPAKGTASRGGPRARAGPVGRLTSPADAPPRAGTRSPGRGRRSRGGRGRYSSRVWTGTEHPTAMTWPSPAPSARP